MNALDLPDSTFLLQSVAVAGYKCLKSVRETRWLVASQIQSGIMYDSLVYKSEQT